MKPPIESPIFRSAVMFSALIVLGLALSLTTTPGCAGQKARSGILLPALAASADPIERYAVRGSLTFDEPEASERRATIQAFFLAIRSQDVAEARAVAPSLWLIVEDSAKAGVRAMFESDEIGPNGMLSLLESIRQFDRSLAKLNVGNATPPPSP